MKTQPNVIGFILKGYPRLSESFIINEIFILEKLGLRLHIFAMRNPHENIVNDRVLKINAKVTYIPDHLFSYFFTFFKTNWQLYRSQPKLYSKVLRFAISTSFHQSSSAPLKRFLQAAYLVQRCLPGNGIVHLHAHFSHDPTTVAFFASRLTGLEYSISAHAKDIYVQDGNFLNQKIFQAKFIVTCTEFNQKHLQLLSNGHTPIFRCYHGIDLDLFGSDQRLIAGGTPQILSVGRLVPKKGFAVLIEALALLRRKGYGFHCQIIGDGPLKATLLKQISDLHLKDYVEILPPVSQQELLQFYRKVFLFALACEEQEDGDRDGIPNVIVEAMAVGLPVVSTNISGIPECVKNNVNGILVREKDPSAFCDALASLITQPNLAREFGFGGKEIVKKHFDASRNIAAIASVFQKVISPNRGIATSSPQKPKSVTNSKISPKKRPVKKTRKPVISKES